MPAGNWFSFDLSVCLQWLAIRRGCRDGDRHALARVADSLIGQCVDRASVRGDLFHDLLNGAAARYWPGHVVLGRELFGDLVGFGQHARLRVRCHRSAQRLEHDHGQRGPKRRGQRTCDGEAGQVHALLRRCRGGRGGGGGPQVRPKVMACDLAAGGALDQWRVFSRASPPLGDGLTSDPEMGAELPFGADDHGGTLNGLFIHAHTVSSTFNFVKLEPRRRLHETVVARMKDVLTYMGESFNRGDGS